VVPTAVSSAVSLTGTAPRLAWLIWTVCRIGSANEVPPPEPSTTLAPAALRSSAI
jgi:hypothetical protein